MRTLLFILTAFFCGYQSIAQLSKTSPPITKSIYTIKGDYYRQHRNYVLAINTYSKAIKQNPKEVSAMLGMADAYHMLSQDDLASQWYRKAFAINPDVGTAQILKYIAILSTSGNSAELRHWVTHYNNRITKSGEPMDSTIFVTENITSLNSNSSDSAPLLYDSKMIFSSDRAAAGNFTSYKSTLNSEGIFGEVSSFHGAVNSGLTEGGFAIATKTATLFFSGSKKESTTTPPAMAILTSAIPAGPSEQLTVNKLTFKNFDYSMMHPAVNSDGTVLYFAANSPKHTHGFDLYYSQYNGKKWSAPISLGPSANSHGDDLYPVLVNDSTLYFSSNGHDGLGGFDIFKVNLRHIHLQPEHLLAPVNSPADEFGFIMNSTGNEGYLSSNRPGGLGGNDLYRIYTLPFKKKKHDAAPKQEELFIYTSKGDEIRLSGSSKENLKFDFQPGQKYNLVVEYDNFRTGTTQTIKNAAILTRKNVYTIDIQKSSEAVYDQKNKSKPVQDIHLNPGDLVTFQLIPNQIQDVEADVSKIQFQKSEVIVADGQSIVFSYVAEGGPGIPEGDVLPVADLSKLDTVSSKQPLAAKVPPTKSAQVAATSSLPTLVTATPALQKSTTPDVANGDKPVNPVAVPVQSAAVKAKDAGPVVVAGNAVETQQQKPKSEQTQGNKVASTEVTPTQALAVQNNVAPVTPLVVAAKTGEKNPVPTKNVNDTTLNKPSVIAKENVNANATEASPTNKVASTEVTPTQPLPVQNKAALATPLVVAAMTGEKNPVPTKNINDTTLNKPSVIAKENVSAKATEASPTNKVASTEVTPTQLLPVQNKAALATPLVVAAKTGEKNPVPTKNANDTTLNKPSVTAKENVSAKATEASPTNKVASTEVTPTQPLPGQNKAALTTPLVVATKTGERNPVPTRNANDTTLNKPSVTAKENVEAKATEASPTNKVASTEVTATQALPVQNNVTKTTPLVPANVNPVRNTTDIQYRVQIAASTSKMSDDQLKKIYAGPKEISSFSEEGYHKYYIEQTPSFPAAKRTMNESGVKQSFIAAYQGDKKLKLPDAIALQKKAGNQTSSPINEPAITNSKTEPISLVKTEPNNSTEVLVEKTSTITNNDGKEKQAVVVTQSSKNLPAQNTIPENKLPVSSGVTREPVGVVNAQVTNEVLPEKIAPVTTEDSKERQVVAVVQSSQSAPGNFLAPEVKSQDTTAKTKPLVSNEGKDKPVSTVNTQPGNSTNVMVENVVPNPTETSKEKQVAVVIPSTRPSTKVPAPDVKTQDNAAEKKPSFDIAGRDDFLYRLQIAASEVRLSEGSLKKIYPGDNEVHSFEEEGKYKYYILETPNYFVADQTLKKINIDHAFIAAYRKDVKVPLEEAINAQYKVPVIKETLAEVDSIVKITTVNFALDEFELQPDQLERLRSIVISELRSNPSYRAIVNGYTDIRGSETYNFGLSQERALFVDQQIVAEGIDATRVTMRYFGESQLVKYCPEHENCDESIHQVNRRVEILLLVNKK